MVSYAHVFVNLIQKIPEIICHVDGDNGCDPLIVSSSVIFRFVHREKLAERNSCVIPCVSVRNSPKLFHFIFFSQEINRDSASISATKITVAPQCASLRFLIPRVRVTGGLFSRCSKLKDVVARAPVHARISSTIGCGKHVLPHELPHLLPS